jgi:hypothetical protein
VGGRWRSYYGSVGNHIVAKVPAEEIEVLERFGPAHPFRQLKPSHRCRRSADEEKGSRRCQSVGEGNEYLHEE